MDEQNIAGLHCIVWHNNNGAEEVCWFKRKQSSFQWLELENIGQVWTHFLSKYICFWESVTLLTMSQKMQILNAWKDTIGECSTFKFSYFSFAFQPLKAFCLHYTWTFLTILGDRFFLQVHHDLFIYQQFVYLVYMRILNTFLPLKGSYIYNIFMTFNKILFSVLTRNAIPALLLRSSNAVFFIGITFWTNDLLSKTGRNALFVQRLFYHPIINAFIAWGLLWTK